MISKVKKYALLGVGGLIGMILTNLLKSKLPF